MTGNGDAFGDLLDKVTRDVVADKLATAQTTAGVDDTNALRAKVGSCVIHSATLTEFYHRLSGDHQQVANADVLGHDEMRGRQTFGNLCNFDEAYDILNAHSMLDDGKTSNKGKSAVNSYQSVFNKFAQYGQASRSTKTAGSYGQVDTPTTSSGLSGNMHFSTYVPMERGECGSHHVAAKERVLISTERPIQPHAPLPPDYPMPDGFSAFKWVPLVKDVAEMLHIAAGAAGPEEAVKLWPKIRCEEDQPESETVDGKTYVPDASGFKVVLPDDVATQVRFRRDPRAPTGFRAEWVVSNRSFPMPPQHSLDTCVPRVCEYFRTPHTALDPSEDALALHQSYQAAYNVKGYLQREGGDAQGGAAQGAAPWHLGMLASALCVFDVFCGIYDLTDEYEERTIAVEEDHVERAAALLKVIYLLKAAAVNTGDEDETGTREAGKEEKRRQEMLQFLGAPASENPFAGVWSQQHFASHVPTQLGASAGALDEAPSGGEADQAHDVEMAAVDEEEAVEEGVAGEEEAAPAERLAQDGGSSLLMEGDVRDVGYGYGVDGVSVQGDEIHSAGLTDRGIMQKTLLQGTPMIKASQACDRMRNSRAKGRRSLPETTWKKVMETGLVGCDVAWYDKGKNTVMLKELPTESESKIEYHNSLMQLCQISLRQLVESMKADVSVSIGCGLFTRVQYPAWLGMCVCVWLIVALAPDTCFTTFQRSLKKMSLWPGTNSFCVNCCSTVCSLRFYLGRSGILGAVGV